MVQTTTQRQTRTRTHASQRVSTLSFMLSVIAIVCSFLPLAVARADLNYDSPYGAIIGIDLGTTTSCVAFQMDRRVDIIANSQGHRTTPTWVAFGDQGPLVGTAAKNASDYMALSPERIVFGARRFIGRSMEDPEIQKDIRVKQWPFNVHADKNGRPVYNVKTENEHRDFTPENISAMVLGQIKETAEAYLGVKVEHAVVTVPTYFNDSQRQATIDAAKLAGLNVLRIIHEPTAAVIAYELYKKGGESNNLVYHLGGQTSEVTLVSIDDGVIEILASGGNTHLGGEDFNQRVIMHILEEYQSKTGIDIGGDFYATGTLKREVERAKRTLSSQQSTRIEVDKVWSETITRLEFEELNDDLFRDTIQSVEQVLQEARVKKDEVHNIILVGGSTRIPKIRQLLSDYFGKEPLKGIEPDEVIAHGAAVQGYLLNQYD